MSEPEECLRKALQEGASLRAAARMCGTTLYAAHKVAKSLRLAQGAEGQEEAEQEQEQAKPQPEEEEAERSVDVTTLEDVRFIMDAVERSLDPKHPIRTKLITDLAWWTHVTLDFSRLVLPEAMKRADVRDIDLKNPEATARALAARVVELMTRAEEADRRVQELQAKVEAERARAEEAERAFEEYRAAVDAELEAVKAEVRDVAEKVKRTIELIMQEVPKYLSEEERAAYYQAVASALRQVWG